MKSLILIILSTFNQHPFCQVNNILRYITYDVTPITVAARSKAWTSSLARTLGSWIRIPLKAWMSVCVYSVCVVLCVSSGLAMDWSPVQGVLPTVHRIKKLESSKVQRRAVDRYIDYHVIVTSIKVWILFRHTHVHLLQFCALATWFNAKCWAIFFPFLPSIIFAIGRAHVSPRCPKCVLKLLVT
jgi:hypothetical protein